MSHNHQLHSQIAGLIVQTAVTTLIDNHHRSNSVAFKTMVANGSKIAAENIWNKYGQKIEEIAARVTGQGGSQQHINAGAQELVNKVWNDHH